MTTATSAQRCRVCDAELPATDDDRASDRCERCLALASRRILRAQIDQARRLGV